MWNYSEKVKDHFLNPRNVGEMEDPTTEAQVGSLACGDALKLQLKIDKDGRIVDAKFRTFGCGSAIASSSALTEMIIGKTVEEAQKITNTDIAKYLDGLPPEKMHCSVMGREALDAAIKKYKGEPIEHIEEEESKLICRCFGVTEEKIRRVIKENNLATVDEVTNYTKAGGACGTCKPDIEDIIRDVRQEMAKDKTERAEPKSAETAQMTNIQKIKKIEQVIEREIKPFLRRDGGDITLIDVDGDRVIVKFEGQCAGCAASQFTTKFYIQDKLQKGVLPTLTVEVVG